MSFDLRSGPEQSQQQRLSSTQTASLNLTFEVKLSQFHLPAMCHVSTVIHSEEGGGEREVYTTVESMVLFSTLTFLDLKLPDPTICSNLPCHLTFYLRSMSRAARRAIEVY